MLSLIQKTFLLSGVRCHRLMVALLILLSLGSSPMCAFGQVAELKAQATALAAAVVPVQSGSKSYEQRVAYQEPAVIRYSYDEIDQKGNRTNYVYEFNIADIDPYAVREQTQKDLISVVVAVRNKQKLIKVYKNEVVQAYDAQTSIIAKDIENARAIADVIKKSIPHAEKVMASRLKLSGYDAMTTWLTANVKDVNFGDKAVKQSVVKGDQPGSFSYSRVEADAKSSTEEVYTFNLADINANAIVYKISGSQFAVGFETLQNARYIRVRRNGAARPFANELIIHTNNSDEARDLKNVLSSAIPFAAEKVKASMPAVVSEKDGLQKVKTFTTDITYGENVIGQSWEGECLAVLTQVEKDPKSSRKNVFKFNWMDVNPLASKIEVSGDKLAIDLKFNEDKKLVMNAVDDKFKGYDNGIRIYMSDIEAARKAKFVMDKVVEKCKTAYKEPFGNDAATTTAYFRNNVKDLSMDDMTLRQTLEAVEGDNTKYKYTLIEVNPKGASAEQVYEFNLADINPGSIAVEVKGKWLYVGFETDFKGKIIKYYKDGKIQPYTSSLQFAVNDVDVARNLVGALGKAVKAVKPK